MLDDLRIVVRNSIDIVQFEIVRIVGVFLRFVTTEKTPTAIQIVVRSFTVHESDTHTIYCDAIGREAGTAT